MTGAMEISSIGHASFKLKGKAVTVVTDPFDPAMVGLTFPKIEADIVTISHGHQDHNQAAIVGESPMIIAGPGEYEVRGVRVRGIQTDHDNENGKLRGKNTMYHVIIDSVNILHCGDLGHKLSEEQVDQVGVVHVLLLPVGGIYTLDAKEAALVVSQLEPNIVIPMHYKRTGLSSAFDALLPVEAFLKEVGKEGILAQPKVTVSKDKLPEELQVVVLE